MRLKDKILAVLYGSTSWSSESYPELARRIAEEVSTHPAVGFKGTFRKERLNRTQADPNHRQSEGHKT